MTQEDSCSNPVVLMMITTNKTYKSCNSKRWFLDIDCSNHMTKNKEWLIEFNTSKMIKVKLAYNNRRNEKDFYWKELRQDSCNRRSIVCS